MFAKNLQKRNFTNFQAPVMINVTQGSLQGEKKFTVLNKKTYLRFLGIPYGKPPIGHRRFKAPKPLKKWEGVYDATVERDCCLQKPPGSKFYLGSEDCLYLNVYTPEITLPVKELKAVMVFIHGGGFCHGSASPKVYGPDYLIEHDIILVTINYRVQALGFLNLGIPECPGNVGLKDQTLALRWIKENIINFGGDPANITIFGESAGATSVHYQIISPLSRGLFHKAIIQSGTCLSTWALLPEPAEVAFSIGQRLGYKGYDRLELLNYLKNQPAKNIVRIADEFREFEGKNNRSTSLFAPSIEAIEEGAILPEHPRILLATAPPIPIICGCNDAEGIFPVGTMSEERIRLISDDITILLKKYFNIDHNNLHSVASQIKQIYFTNDRSRKETLHSLSNLLTDILFYYFEESFETASKSSFPPYIYEFAYEGGQNSLKQVFVMKTKCGFRGACHGDELDYLFYRKFHLAHKKIDQTDLKVINNMCSIWTNFAKTGNPSIPVWKPYTPDEPCYLQIGANSLQPISGSVHGPRRQYLKNILHPYEMKAFSTN